MQLLESSIAWSICTPAEFTFRALLFAAVCFATVILIAGHVWYRGRKPEEVNH